MTERKTEVVFPVAQWIKDPVLSLLWLGSPLWHGFSPWPLNFHMPWVQPKKKKREKRERSKFNDKRGQPWAQDKKEILDHLS